MEVVFNYFNIRSCYTAATGFTVLALGPGFRPIIIIIPLLPGPRFADQLKSPLTGARPTSAASIWPELRGRSSWG